MLGAARVIAIDRFDYRLDKAREAGATDLIDYEQVEVPVVLKELTGGRGPDACIDCVGLEAHHPQPLVHGYDRVKQAARLHGQVSDRLTHEPIADRQDRPSARA
jgi:threonine dehydrogenase-like Zn-dependent dehydrogenase